MFSYKQLLSSPQKSPVFLIAEIGINHDGDSALAQRMIDSALDAGADAVKFQIYSIDGFYHQKSAPGAYALFQNLSLPLSDFYKLRDYAYKRGLLCFAAPFSRDVLEDFIQNEVFPIKIASGDAPTEPWITRLLEAEAPFIVSCGAMSQAENTALADKIRGAQAALLYCVSQYPASPELFDLLYVDELRRLLPGQAVGFSDHSQGLALSIAAAARGAKIIERHFTLNPERTDLDHPLSLSPEAFSALVQGVRAVEKALGSGVRRLDEAERALRPLAGRSVYLTRRLEEGQEITESCLALLRPGRGVASSFYRSLIGRRVPRAMDEGENLSALWEE